MLRFRVDCNGVVGLDQFFLEEGQGRIKSLSLEVCQFGEAEGLQGLREKEAGMRASDRGFQETHEEKNRLQECCYRLKEKLEGCPGPDREGHLAAVRAQEQWLEDEGQDSTREEYARRREELLAL